MLCIWHFSAIYPGGLGVLGLEDFGALAGGLPGFVLGDTAQQLRAVFDVELAETAGEVVFNGVLADDRQAGDLAVGLAQHEPAQHFALAPGEGGQ